MKNDTLQTIETSRKPMRRDRRRFSELAPGVQKLALDNLEFHRDVESVSRRFEVHQSGLMEALFWRTYDRMTGRNPSGPMSLRRLAA